MFCNWCECANLFTSHLIANIVEKIQYIASNVRHHSDPSLLTNPFKAPLSNPMDQLPCARLSLFIELLIQLIPQIYELVLVHLVPPNFMAMIPVLQGRISELSKHAAHQPRPLQAVVQHEPIAPAKVSSSKADDDSESESESVRYDICNRTDV